ncbi:LiaI-LiaF-like domain-containing protein [Massilia antarctica]|uniref:LiaI-LiaF-like domain-containing protein n=1 Tax=Massilia antarctica TaxID=2765360 RepID=UPI0006BB80A2|nr:DUF5668 domain-containing protein [Massilia sp. H27-R4]MCY0910708.1 DUF5668 domain-containing protein [Massilia sp. H27-R4]CUI08918.1 hypothetical protein BN2497_12613 [Janthinobacterium sp. CG23_2]CUU32704.1 hypothetical protein BN3177_12613 [Janthinobacterium sp. CG23_2]
MKNDTRNSGIPNQVWLGLAVIAFGLLFLLDNLNIIDRHRVLHYWPVLVVIGGLVKYAGAETQHERMVFGLITAAGVILTLNRLGYGYFFNARTLWPVLLILLGIGVIHKAMRKGVTPHAVPLKDDVDVDVDADADADAWAKPGAAADARAGADANAVVDITAILGGFERRISTPAFRGGDICAIMGGCVLDLRDSSIVGDAELNVFAVMGGITIKCPPDWSVVLKGVPILGGFEEKTSPAPGTGKRLTIRGYAIMGGVEVRN